MRRTIPLSHTPQRNSVQSQILNAPIRHVVKVLFEEVLKALHHSSGKIMPLSVQVARLERRLNRLGHSTPTPATLK